jgi:hypothetical protein
LKPSENPERESYGISHMADIDDITPPLLVMPKVGLVKAICLLFPSTNPETIVQRIARTIPIPILRSNVIPPSLPVSL